jgi:hypothetical protein
MTKVAPEGVEVEHVREAISGKIRPVVAAYISTTQAE